MKQWLGKCTKIIALATHNASIQSKIAVLLMSVIPGMSLFYMGTVVGADVSHLSTVANLVIYTLTATVAVSGFLILRKYPNNILKLRQYVTTIAWGTLPERIALDETESSDDLKYIEDSFNILLCELRNKIAKADEQMRVEHSLRKTIDKQQQILIEAERHRAMVQTLGAAGSHISRPIAVLRTRLEILQKQVTNKEEIKEIEACLTAMKPITDLLNQLQQTCESRTAPYL